MPETYSETQKRISRESIFTALVKLLEKKSFSEITITQITKLAGVSRMAFYRNYQTKEDVIVFYAKDIFDELFEIVNSMEIADKRNITGLYFSFFKEKSYFLNVLIKSGLTHIFYEVFFSALTEFFKSQADKVRDNPAFTNYIAQYTAAGLFRILMEWIGGGMVESVDAMADFVCEITG